MAEATHQPERSHPDQHDRHGTHLRAGSIGVFGLMFFVFSAQAPLTGIIGPTPITIAVGNGPGAPAASLIVGVVLCLFAVGFIEFARRLDVHGAFYAYIAEALGDRVGVGAGWVAILAYGTVQAALYGLYGSIASGLLSAVVGFTIPWWVIVLITVAFVQLLGSRNIELGARLLAVLVLTEFLVITAFCIGVLVRGGGPEGFDFAASFAPSAVLTGAPGVAIVFAVGSMIGFESTAIYAEEAKDPARSIPRATYLAVAVIALFNAFALWMVVSFYGPSKVVGAAEETIAGGDSSIFVLQAMGEVLGGWIIPVSAILLTTSLLAGIIAFHNGVNRYLHSLAVRGAMPRALSRTNKHLAPANAAMTQSIMAVITTMPFAVFGSDPELTLFPWGAGVAVLALLVLYVLCSIAVIVYFQKHDPQASLFKTRVMPVIASIALLGLLTLVVVNFGALIGSFGPISIGLLFLVPIAFIAGVISTFVFGMSGPNEPEPGPHRGIHHEHPPTSPDRAIAKEQA